MPERRKIKRFLLNLPGTIVVSVPGREEMAFDLKTSDISADGAFFHTDQAAPKGVRVRLRLILKSSKIKELAGAHGLIELSGTVVRSTAAGFDECPGDERRRAQRACSQTHWRCRAFHV